MGLVDVGRLRIVGVAGVKGIVKVMVVPLSGSDSMETVPLWASMIPLVM